jgi:hypothetical protein
MPDLTVQPDATCEWEIPDPLTDGDLFPCGRPSRFIVERDDSDPAYTPAESCEAHLGDVVPWMADGDDNVKLTVSIRWDVPAEAGNPVAGQREDGKRD